jgi:aspartate/methionine/tyrosine aminotransferase
MARLGTETAFEVLVRAKALEAQGHDVVHLEIGEPDFATPENIVAAAAAALQGGCTHYGPAVGQPELRQTIAQQVAQTNNLEIAPEQVVVTPGGKPIMFFVLLALVDHGDEVIYPNPGFPIYESMINFSGGVPVPIPFVERDGFQWDIDHLEQKISPRTKLIIVNSPHNPTGGMLNRESIARIAELAIRHDIAVLSDEIYDHIVYEGEQVGMLSIPGMAKRTILLNGFSKTYAMTGWRIGYGVMPRSLAEQVGRLVVNSVSCTASFTQYAAIEALRGPQEESERMVGEFLQRRDVMVAGLNSISGISCQVPRGAFYVFPNIAGTGLSSREFADRLLQESYVAGLAGTSFGQFGEGYIRFSYANSIENIEKAIERIRQFVTRLSTYSLSLISILLHLGCHHPGRPGSRLV